MLEVADFFRKLASDSQLRPDQLLRTPNGSFTTGRFWYSAGALARIPFPVPAEAPRWAIFRKGFQKFHQAGQAYRSLHSVAGMAANPCTNPPPADRNSLVFP